MGYFYREILDVVHTILPRSAAEQGGIISGDNPVTWNASDPFRLWVVQISVIIAMTQFLSLFLRRIRQPRVIAEVIGGIILGPTVMGKIPHFKARIFPDNGMPGLALTSTIGLVLYLFLVGLEIDTSTLKRNLRASSAVSAAGLLIPLGLGAALGTGVYKEFINPNVNEGYFILFTAVAIGITAFPVLCRILTELKLLEDPVGIVTLTAGVGNDVVGWVLLALTVALINAGSGLTALYVLLSGVGYLLLLFYPIRWGYVWLARRTGSVEQGTPTTAMMTITLFLIFASAFFTDIIGIHAIFGGFICGLIVPHDNGFAISLVEKLEDLVSIVLLPLYFTLSGLKTDLSSLNTGTIWGYIILICLVAFSSKFFACSTAAYLSGFNCRESGAIGALMSCKGLVELIVLNIGLQAKILDTKTFSMFVVHALVLTFMTTPLTLAFYPPKYRNRANLKKDTEAEGDLSRPTKELVMTKSRFAIVLEKMEQIPAAMTLAKLLQPHSARSTQNVQELTSLPSLVSSAEKAPQSSPTPEAQQISINALRLIELDNRTSAVLKSQEAESLIAVDPVISVFRTFGQLNQLRVSASLSVANLDEFSEVVTGHIIKSNSQMVLLPWSNALPSLRSDDSSDNRSLFKDGPSHIYSEFIRNVFSNSPVDVGVFLDKGLSLATSQDLEHHLIVPFFGGPDDRLALTLAVQMCGREFVTATVVRIQKSGENLTAVDTIEEEKITVHHNTVAAPDTVYGQNDIATRLSSETADNVLWSKFTQDAARNGPNVIAALSRMNFTTQSTAEPLHAVVDLVNGRAGGKQNVIAIVGRSRRLAVESHQAELTQMLAKSGKHIGVSVSKTVGEVGAALMIEASTGLLVVQASG